MITVPLINWQPITAMPDDRKDGRQMLLRLEGSAVVGAYDEGGDGLGSSDNGDIGCDGMYDYEPTHWADINPPE